MKSLRHALSLLALPLAAISLLGSPPVAQESSAPIRFGDPAGSYDVPFFPGSSYDPSIRTPDDVLGQRHGSRLARHDEILTAFRAWSEQSKRLSLHTYGRTHEGRELVYAIITSPENQLRLDTIKENLGHLQDPRGITAGQLDMICTNSPAVAWMGYSIHGDELSGADASLAVGYQLVAGQSEAIEELLKHVVIVLDPCMNPDGRERIRSMVEQSAGYTPNLDYASMQRGRWPFGRGNHYLFDMNRDWMAGTQPETQGRWRVALEFHPQLFVDAHEMESLDTFLFYPQNRALNPELPEDLVPWQRKYAEGAASAFDQRGWSYYTREWADAWAPFYSDAWGSLNGATGMLYEQAGIKGFALRRNSGEVLTYRESVHHQAVASLANLHTLGRNREAALRAYLATGKRNVAEDTPGNDRMLVIESGRNSARMRELRRILDGQHIEYQVADEAFEAAAAVNILGDKSERIEVHSGALIVQARQPRAAVLKAYLGFDPRMQHGDLLRERESLETKGFSKIYDATSWSLALAFNLDAHWCDAKSVGADAKPSSTPAPRFLGSAPAVAWAISGDDDAAISFVARALDGGLQLSACDALWPLVSDAAHTLPRGSFMLRAVENGGASSELEDRLMQLARAAGVLEIHRLGTQLSPDETSSDTPDLGGGHFTLLSRPRVAMLAGSPVASDTYGHLWHHLDALVGLPVSFLNAHSLGGYDLRRYNVLILPPGDLYSLLEENLDAIESWVQAGGTLVACGSSASALSAGKLGLSSVIRRRDALEDLAPYALATKRARAARQIEVDDALVWGEKLAGEPDEDDYEAVEVPEAHDRWLRTFSPAGVMLRAELNAGSWLTYGAEGEMPVYVEGSSVLLNDGSAETAVQLAPADKLRAGGLLWPEARERLADSAWLTSEALGSGQVILFSAVPAYRGYLRASARMFANAVVLGPGMGADQPKGW